MPRAVTGGLEIARFKLDGAATCCHVVVSPIHSSRWAREPERRVRDPTAARPPSSTA